MGDPRYPTPMARAAAVNNYLRYDPEANSIYPELDARYGRGGSGNYSYDPAGGTVRYTTSGPQHWWTDPRVMGPIIVGAAGGVAGLAAGGPASTS